MVGGGGRKEREGAAYERVLRAIDSGKKAKMKDM